jgi:hypothetical protein
MRERSHFLDRPALVFAVVGAGVSFSIWYMVWELSGSFLPGCAPSDSPAYCASVWTVWAMTLVPPVILLIMLVRDRLAR